MLKKTLSIVLVLFLGACASGGGGSGALVTPSTPPSGGGTTTEPDKRIPFDDWEIKRSIDIEGYSDEVKIVHTMTSYTTTGLPAPTEKFKIADYGFLQSTIYGNHNGCDDCGEESNNSWSFVNDGMVRQADLNGDGHWDFYLWMWYGGDKEYVPETVLMAWVNDGTGHFELKQDLFEGSAPCMNGGGINLQFVTQETQGDPYRDCGWSGHFRNPAVADFNGDGIDDFFNVSKLILSNNGKLVDVSHSNLPKDLFFNTDYGPIFSHDIAIGDTEGDGDIDIFLPIHDNAWNNEILPWAMLINDGSGNFTVNNNFPKIPEPWQVEQDPSLGMLWATTAAVGDFDNDGYGDVSVGWFNPSLAREYGFGETYENSAGAVFFNDGTNDWRNRPWLELPDSYYGENGNANSMAVIDFNGDGFLDIVVASTKHQPYYQGRMIQFFLNNGGNSFTDVTSQYGDTTYANGGINNPNLWNGEGYLMIVDFDNDGDLDIVDSNTETYVLLNDGDTFTLYNDFPKFTDGRSYHAVEIDGEHWYDFIGSESTYSSSQSTTTFFQVLDPPFAEMQHDITTKPYGYVDGVFNNFILTRDLRKQTDSTRVFYSNLNNNTLKGYSWSGNNYGITVGELSGNTKGGLLALDADIDNLHIGVFYTDSTHKGYNRTKWYGTGVADVDYKSLNTFTEFTNTLRDNYFYRAGAGLSYTWIESFNEQNSKYNVKVDKFSMQGFNIFADINALYDTKFGQTFLTAGVDYYTTMKDTKIQFADVLEYSYNNEIVVGRASFTHVFGNFYLNASADTENNETYELGFRLAF